MIKAKVLIPFYFFDKEQRCVPGDEIEITEEQLTKIKAINVNMVLVLGEVKPKKKSK